MNNDCKDDDTVFEEYRLELNKLKDDLVEQIVERRIKKDMKIMERRIKKDMKKLDQLRKEFEKSLHEEE